LVCHFSRAVDDVGASKLTRPTTKRSGNERNGYARRANVTLAGNPLLEVTTFDCSPEMSNPTVEENDLRRIDPRVFAAAALSALALFQTTSVLADETVTFAAASHAGGPAAQTSVKGYLAKPPGKGPFPAVVLLHTCLGLPSNRREMENEFVGLGYVALFVDDFATRRLKETCAVDFPEGVADAYGALAFLAKLPDVDPARIAAIGYSQGADTALTLASSRFASAYRLPQGLAFKSAAAFYPPCANQSGAAMRMPTLILVGQTDEVTPAGDCEALARGQTGAVALHVYPGAPHGFDNPEFGAGRLVLGMRLAYDRAAADQARAELRRFLKANL
jgi:dienelactone hydrolase